MTRFLSSTLLPVSFRVRLLTPKSRKKGTLIMKGLLRNLDEVRNVGVAPCSGFGSLLRYSRLITSSLRAYIGFRV